MAAIIKPSYEILTDISNNGSEELARIASAARVCYQSSPASSHKLVQKLIESGHESQLEHSSLSVKFICDRGISHEIVRHRLFSFSQESTRYCNYSKDKFDSEITFILPCFIDPTTTAYDNFVRFCQRAECEYFDMLNFRFMAQEARAVLPNCVKTTLVVTGNYREWRSFLKLRTASDAHPQMRELTIPLLRELQSKIPIIFDDILPEKTVPEVLKTASDECKILLAQQKQEDEIVKTIFTPLTETTIDAASIKASIQRLRKSLSK